jgi:dipeptidyl-peptidase 4
MNTKAVIRFCMLSLVLFVFTVSFSQEYQPLTVSKIHKENHFYPVYIDGLRSMNDGEHYTVIENDHIIAKYDYISGENKTIILNTDDFSGSDIGSFSDYSFSADENKILLTTKKSAIYRNSFEADYQIYDLIAKTVSPLYKQGKQQLATFSPDGSKVSFIMANNLFYKDLESGKIVQITFDGKINSIINGAPDWVYEEEFSFTQGYCWSPDSRYIAFYKFDESAVKQFDMTIFSGLYPYTSRFKYPKAGEENSTVSIHTYNFDTEKTTMLDSGEEPERYVPRIKWSATPGKLCIIRLNRLQNKVDVTLADADTGNATVIFTEENERYISKVDDNYIHFTADRKYFIVLSERSGFYHYYRYTIGGLLINAITKGNWEVQEVLGMDDKNEMLYYRSNQQATILSDVYAVKFDGTKPHKLSDEKGYNSAEFSKNFKYYINTWSNANTPYNYTLHNIKGNLIRVLEDNTLLKKEMKLYGFTAKEFIHVPAGNGLDLSAYIIKPPDFDSTKKYPLFIGVYGGPESQDVTDSWDNQLAWYELLAQHGIVVACVDNRGTDGRGEAFRKSTYLQLGRFETEDQINAAIYMGRKNWIDANRIGIWGWSYGGYMTLLCLTKGANVFKTGIAVAPVTNWRFYDTIYTERYMRKPQDNAAGYDDNSPINYAGELKGKLLLIHGTADDNVHLQNSVEMADRLIRENKQFDMFFYPDKNHSISGGNTRYHLFSMITEFVFKNL